MQKRIGFRCGIVQNACTSGPPESAQHIITVPDYDYPDKWAYSTTGAGEGQGRRILLLSFRTAMQTGSLQSEASLNKASTADAHNLHRCSRSSRIAELHMGTNNQHRKAETIHFDTYFYFILLAACSLNHRRHEDFVQNPCSTLTLEAQSPGYYSISCQMWSVQKGHQLSVLYVQERIGLEQHTSKLLNNTSDTDSILLFVGEISKNMCLYILHFIEWLFHEYEGKFVLCCPICFFSI